MCRFEIGFAEGNPITSSITLRQKLDFEVKNEYNFFVYAFDLSPSPQTSQATVRIFVLDVNDIGPEFTQAVYTGRVAEGDVQFESEIKVTVS